MLKGEVDGPLQYSRCGDTLLVQVGIAVFLLKSSLASVGCTLPALPGEQGERSGLAEETAGACRGETRVRVSQGL